MSINILKIYPFIMKLFKIYFHTLHPIIKIKEKLIKHLILHILHPVFPLNTRPCLLQNNNNLNRKLLSISLILKLKKITKQLQNNSL